MNGALPQNQFQNLSHSPDRSGNRSFSLCAARHWTKRIRPFTAFDRDGGDDHLRLTGYGYSCIGIDARSNEKPYSTMRVAPDGFHGLGEARVGSQLPELLNKKSNYRRCADWKFVREH